MCRSPREGLAYSHVLPWVIPAEQVGVRIEPQSSRNGRRPQVTGPGGRLLFAAQLFWVNAVPHMGEPTDRRLVSKTSENQVRLLAPVRAGTRQSRCVRR